MKSTNYARHLAALPLLALALGACSANNDAIASASDAQVADALKAQSDIQPTGVTGWNFPVYDVPADPSVKYGVLDNGLKFAIMRNETPQEQVILRLGFDVGWIEESDDIANAAHFIEHMAFNGSTNIPEGEMIKLLEREGLSFGADTNAETHYEHTIYKLDLPRNDDALVDTGFMLLREIASELTITPEAVDRERGVLLSEIQTFNTYDRRRTSSLARFIAPNTVYAQKTGRTNLAETTSAVTAEQLRALYEGYYRPDNAVLVVVGDVDPAEIEAKLRDAFADWERPEDPIGDVDRGSVDFERPAAAETFVDPAVNWFVSLYTRSPYTENPETIAEMRQSMLDQLGAMIMGRRFQRIARDPASAILGGGASSSDYFDAMRVGSTSVTAKEGQWREALATAEQEQRRAMLHGFTEAEVSEALANLETRYRNAAARAGSRRSADLASGIIATVPKERIFQTPATNLAIFEQIKPTLTQEAIHAAFRESFTGSEPLIHVSAKEQIEGGEEAILAAFQQSRAVPVAAPAEEQLATFGYEDFGPAGTVVADEMVEDLGFRKVRFANNVLLNMKTTDFKDDEVLFRVRVGSGQLAFGSREPGASLLMNSFFATAGLGKHSIDELQRMLAGQNIVLGLQVQDDKFVLTANTKPSDLARQMQVSTAYVVDPGYRTEVDAQWQAAVPAYLARLDATAISVANSRVARIVANGDRRFGAQSGDVLLGTTLEDLKAVVEPATANSPIEITVVGDIDEAEVIASVAATFGALPEREAALSDHADARQVSFAKDRSLRTLYHTGAADQGLVQVFWPTTDDDNFEDEVTSSLVAEVVRIRLLETLREELGATYTPEAGSNMSDVYDDFGYVVASAIVAPENQAKVFETIDAIINELAANGVSADLLDRARNPILERLDQRRRENGYWLGVLDEAQLRPERLDRARQYETLVRATTPSAIQNFITNSMANAEPLRIAIVPKPAGE